MTDSGFQDKKSIQNGKSGQFMNRFVLFDFDGTIYDTVEGITRCVAYAAEKQGIIVRPEELRCFAGPPLVPMFMSYFGMNEDNAMQALTDFRERYVPVGVFESRVFPEIPGCLSRIRAKGFRMAIATSKPERETRRLLERSGLTDFFEFVSGGQPTGKDITKPEAVARALRQLEAGPGEAVMVGDTRYDIEGAHINGIPCIGVTYGFAAPGELEAAGADVIVDSPNELAAYFEALT